MGGEEHSGINADVDPFANNQAVDFQHRDGFMGFSPIRGRFGDFNTISSLAYAYAIGIDYNDHVQGSSITMPRPRRL
ncbi:MAG: hypothetical protein ACE5Z5_11605 [Candidatus Bathyarchaeia archaeon]